MAQKRRRQMSSTSALQLTTLLFMIQTISLDPQSDQKFRVCRSLNETPVAESHVANAELLVFEMMKSAYLRLMYVLTGRRTGSRILKQVTGLIQLHLVSAPFGLCTKERPKSVNWNLALDWWVHLCNYIQPSHLLWRDICHRASSSLLECQLVGVARERRWKIVSFQHTCRSPGCLCNKCLSSTPPFFSFLSFFLSLGACLGRAIRVEASPLGS